MFIQPVYWIKLNSHLSDIFGRIEKNPLQDIPPCTLYELNLVHTNKKNPHIVKILIFHSQSYSNLLVTHQTNTFSVVDDFTTKKNPFLILYVYIYIYID